MHNGEVEGSVAGEIKTVGMAAIVGVAAGRTLTAKLAWELVRIYLRAITDVSFGLKVKRANDGEYLIFAACGVVKVGVGGLSVRSEPVERGWITNEDGDTEAYIEDVHDGELDVVTGKNTIDFGLNEDEYLRILVESGVSFERNWYSYTSFNHFSHVEMVVSEWRAPWFDYVGLLATKYYKGYEKRSNIVLRITVAGCLDEDTRRIANLTASLFYPNWDRRVNLICQYRAFFLQVERDNKRLLSALMMRYLYGDGRRLRAPLNTVKNIKAYLLKAGMTEVGWRYFCKLQMNEMLAWDDLFGKGVTRKQLINTGLLNLIAKLKLRITLYRLYDISHYAEFLGGKRSSDPGRLLLLTCVLQALAAAQKANKGRLSNKLATQVMNRFSGCYDFVYYEARGNDPLVVPAGATVKWLWRATAAWHFEIANRSIDFKGNNYNWSMWAGEQFEGDFLEVREDKFMAKMLVDKRACYVESSTMHHCVSSRWELASAGSCFLFHLEFIRTGYEMEQATLDVRFKGKKYFVYECRGVCNCDVSAEMRGFVDRLVLQMNIKEKLKSTLLSLK